MKSALSLLVMLLALAAPAFAQEQAFTNRSTELKDKAAADARTVATLPENTAVKVIGRGGAWTNVDASGQAGWVRAFHLRFPVVIEKGGSSSNPLSGISSMFGGGRQEKATIATTGIRGLTPDDLKSSSPNNEALAKANSYRSDKPTAERFAREGKLENTKVDYTEGGRR